MSQTTSVERRLLNVTSLEEARALMDNLPLGQAGLMKHEFIELGPLTPFHVLIPSRLYISARVYLSSGAAQGAEFQLPAVASDLPGV